MYVCLCVCVCTMVKPEVTAIKCKSLLHFGELLHQGTVFGMKYYFVSLIFHLDHKCIFDITIFLCLF